MLIFSTQRSGTTAFFNALWKFCSATNNPKFGLGEFLQPHIVGHKGNNTINQLDQDFKSNVPKKLFPGQIPVLNTRTVEGFDYDKEAMHRIEFVKYCIANKHNPLLKIFPNSFINGNILEDIAGFAKEHDFDSILLYRQNLRELILSWSIMTQYIQTKPAKPGILASRHNNTDNKPINAQPDPNESINPGTVVAVVTNYMSLMKLWQTNLCSQTITYEDMFFNNTDRSINLNGKPVSLSKIFDIKKGRRVYQMDYNGYAKEEYFNNSKIISEIISQEFEKNNLTLVAEEMGITY
jgi:hypothetical protein